MQQVIDKTATKALKILLVEDNPGDARLIQETLAEANVSGLELVCVDRLSLGLERLGAGEIDLALLDLSLPDSAGLDTLTRTHARSPEVPIVVLTSLDDEMLALEALKKGAQDYLIKGHLDASLLVRTMRYAIERRRIQEKQVH